MSEIRNHFYRVSIKALILNETRDKFLIIREEDGAWELPGGGLDWGASPQEDVKREIAEEMGLEVTWVAERPSYFFTCTNSAGEIWLARVLYEVAVKNLDFTPSGECTELKFVTRDDITSSKEFSYLKQLAEQFDPKNH